MYRGKLIDVSKVDKDNREVMDRISDALRRIRDEGLASLDTYGNKLSAYIRGMRDSMERSDIGAIEKRKTIFTKLLFIAGSAVKPESMPAEMYGRQNMPEKKRAEFYEYHRNAEKYHDQAREHEKALLRFRDKYQEMWRKALLSDESRLDFLRRMNGILVSGTVKKENLDTGIIFRLLAEYGLIPKDSFGDYAGHGIAFTNTKMHQILRELNDRYGEEYRDERLDRMEEDSARLREELAEAEAAGTPPEEIFLARLAEESTVEGIRTLWGALGLGKAHRNLDVYFQMKRDSELDEGTLGNFDQVKEIIGNLLRKETAEGKA